MKGPYKDYNISCVEREIISLYKGRKHMQDERKQAYCLLSIRKKMLDHWACQHQYDLLPVIKEFNMALNCALKELCTEAHSLYECISEYEPKLELKAKLNLSSNYPRLHPYHADDREVLWDALLYGTWNPMIKNGIAMSHLSFPRDANVSFEQFIFDPMGSGKIMKDGWWRGEGFFMDAKDEDMLEYGFNSVFYNLIEHTNLALTDFIYVRDFEKSIIVIREDEKSYLN
jgi:hypothetical protein